MPTNPDPLTFGTFYHIYNRGNNHENVFLQERNYSYFMELWWKHTSKIAETCAYCLLKNHFHATVFIKYEEDLKGLKLKEPSQYFANFFNAYTRGVNIAANRSGALFEVPFNGFPSQTSVISCVSLCMSIRIHKEIQPLPDFDDEGETG